MKPLIPVLLAASLLAACQSAGPGLTPSLGGKPSVLTSKSVPDAKVRAVDLFTAPEQGFRVVDQTSSHLLFAKVMPANVNDRNPLQTRTKGKPVVQIDLEFDSEGAKTRVTGDIWMLLNPKGPDYDTFSLLETPDGPRLQRKLNEIR